MRIEICIENNNEEFEHEGYYDSIREAIDALHVLNGKEISELLEKEFQHDCTKCVWYMISCLGGLCPPDKEYKRDPPDGGYYG